MAQVLQYTRWIVYGHVTAPAGRAITNTFTSEEQAWAHLIQKRLQYGALSAVLVKVETFRKLPPYTGKQLNDVLTVIHRTDDNAKTWMGT